MTSIQLLEQLAVNPTYKRDIVSGKGDTSIFATRAQIEISELLKEQSKIWCALLPAEDEESTNKEVPARDTDDDDNEEQRSDN